MATRFRITLHDETELIVTPTVEDRLAFESTLRKNKGWGSLGDNGLRMVAFMGWHCARRAHGLTQTWAEFAAGPLAAIDVSQIREDEDTEIEEDELGPVEVDGLGEGTPPDPYTL